jgi:hypothetical protein
MNRNQSGSRTFKDDGSKISNRSHVVSERGLASIEEKINRGLE